MDLIIQHVKNLAKTDISLITGDIVTDIKYTILYVMDKYHILCLGTTHPTANNTFCTSSLPRLCRNGGNCMIAIKVIFDQ